MTDPATTQTRMPPEDAGRELDQLGPVHLADLLLAAVAGRHAGGLSLDPRGSRHALRADLRGVNLAIGSIASELADATCARLALVAGVALGVGEPQLGRVRVRVGDAEHVTELLVSVRPAPGGLGVAIHRIADTSETDVGAVASDGESDAASRYLLGEEMGRGGMGVVYRAEHVVLQKPVAIKVLRSGLADDPTLAAQFVLEARAACRARHPGIVDVTDFGRFPDGRAFIVMELVEGETLADTIAGGALPPSRAVAIARRIASALRAAADAGVVHRDLKPSNVFVLEEDRIKIADFGVACILDGVKSATGVVGTAGYMAPEQARGQPVDARADLYALGCVLFEMLVGKPPFEGGSISELLERHSTAPVPVIESPHGTIPVEVSRVVQRAMAKRPEERYQSASEMLTDLGAAARALAPVGWRRWQP